MLFLKDYDLVAAVSYALGKQVAAIKQKVHTKSIHHPLKQLPVH